MAVSGRRDVGSATLGTMLAMAAMTGACSHAASPRSTGITCQPAGPATVAGMDAAAACALVRDRVEAGLGRRAGVAITLDLTRRNSAVARIEGRPEIAVDVMDRALGRDDLLQLADAIVRNLAAPGN